MRHKPAQQVGRSWSSFLICVILQLDRDAVVEGRGPVGKDPATTLVAKRIQWRLRSKANVILLGCVTQAVRVQIAFPRTALSAWPRLRFHPDCILRVELQRLGALHLVIHWNLRVYIIDSCHRI